MASKSISIDLEDVRKLAALQCTDAEAAAFFEIGVPRWKRILTEHENVLAAWTHGRENGKISLRRKQFRLASMSASMAIHLGKNILGQRDVSTTEHTGAGGGPMQIIDPGKLTQDERDKLRELVGRSKSE